MEVSNGFSERARQLERRMDKSEDDRVEIWRHQGRLEQSITKLEERMANLGEDVKDLTEEMRAAKRAMWSVALGSFGVVVALCTLIIQGVN